MSMNRIKVTVRGAEYTLMSDNTPEYVRALAGRLEERLNALLGRAQHMPIVTALVLTNINALDELHAAEADMAALRAQSEEYLEQAAASQEAVAAARRDEADAAAQVALLTQSLREARERAAALRTEADAAREALVAAGDAAKQGTETVRATEASGENDGTAALAERLSETEAMLAEAKGRCAATEVRAAVAENRAAEAEVRAAEAEARAAEAEARAAEAEEQAAMAEAMRKPDDEPEPMAQTTLTEAVAREAQSRVEELTADTARLREALAAAERQSGEYGRLLTAARREAELARTETEEARAKVAALQDTNTKQSEEIDWLYTEVDNAQSEANRAAEAAATANKELETLKRA